MICLLLAALLGLTLPGNDDPFGASLPRETGEVSIEGLTAPVEIARDVLGVPAIRGAIREDVFRALGFVHAQERFFQMDAARRLAAGELSEIAGTLTVVFDRPMRHHRFRVVANEVFARMDDDDRRQLAAYTAGVNAGLADLGAPPPEYVVLQAPTEPWVEADSVLVLLAMFDMLNFSAGEERVAGIMAATLPPELCEFLMPSSTRFDALLPASTPNDHEPAAIPGPDIVDLRTLGPYGIPIEPLPVQPVVPGSNNWAVAAARSATGTAIVANDPHLRLSLPGIWYRCQLAWADRQLTGVSLPGLPGIAIGSNGRVAWGFTNSMIDFQDLVIVEVDPDDPARYRTPDGTEPFEEIIERIDVLRGDPIELRLRQTRWGIVTREDHLGRPLVLRWTALDADTVNLGNLELMDATSVDDAIAVARRAWGPSQNLIVGDAGGRIGWTVTGYIPRRVGFDGSMPVSWADGTAHWGGPIDEADRPVIVDPEEGVLFTANNRTLPLEQAKRLSATWASGHRARRIGERLAAQPRFDERDMLDIQLDTRLAAFDFYRDLAIDVLESDPAPSEVRRTALEVLRGWNGTADADQSATTLLDTLRATLHREVFLPLIVPCRKADPVIGYHRLMLDETLRRVLEERPPHFLTSQYADWDAMLDAAVQDAINRVSAVSENGPRLPWGERNRAQIHHFLAGAAPAFASMLSMPDDPLVGHFAAVRVASPSFGASMRMVVSPGRETDGILHIPAGQSGHPLSPHYRSSHADWLEGRATPLLAGPAQSTLTLTPAR